MRKVAALNTVLLLLSNITLGKPKQGLDFLDYFIMSPLSTTKMSKGEVKTKAINGIETTVRITIFNEKQPLGFLIYDHTFYGTSVGTFQYANVYTCESNLLVIEYTGMEGFESYSQNITLNHSDQPEIDEEMCLYSTSDYIKFTPKKGFELVKEKYDFYGFNEYYVPDYYHKLDLNDFYYYANNIFFDSIYCEPYLIVTNKDRVFDELASNHGDSFVRLELQLLEYEDNIYSFKFLDKLYVNKENLQMSKIPKQDYVETKFLFFPINEMKNQDEYICTLVLDRFGYDEYKVEFSFSLKALLNTMGDCNTSEYCISHND